MLLFYYNLKLFFKVDWPLETCKLLLVIKLIKLLTHENPLPD